MFTTFFGFYPQNNVRHSTIRYSNNIYADVKDTGSRYNLHVNNDTTEIHYDVTAFTKYTRITTD